MSIARLELVAFEQPADLLGLDDARDLLGYEHPRRCRRKGQTVFLGSSKLQFVEQQVQRTAMTAAELMPEWKMVANQVGN